MRYMDCHVHMDKKPEKLENMLARMDEAGVEAVGLLSFAPERFGEVYEEPCPVKAKDRLDAVMDWAKRSDRIFPYFWIDPLEEDALEQVDLAVERGVDAFKVICDRFYPCDERPMEVWRYIAEKKKPILFHSGILYSPHPSSRYNRPVNFEALFEIPNLRFALAHVSWPWYDECIALFGQWQYLYGRGLTTAELFLDTTPGTPKLYREEVFTKLFHTGIDVENYLMQGSDCIIDYNVDYYRYVQEMDRAVINKLGLTEAQQEKYYYKNLLRFLGKEE